MDYANVGTQQACDDACEVVYLFLRIRRARIMNKVIEQITPAPSSNAKIVSPLVITSSPHGMVGHHKQSPVIAQDADRALIVKGLPPQGELLAFAAEQLS